MDRPISFVDAFSEVPFEGNPAAVCVLKAPASESWMQSVAAEVNLSETAFLHPVESGWRLRWFTPTVEVDLCGHATLAAAHVLWTEGHSPPGRTLRFDTLSGVLQASRAGEARISLDFPSKPVSEDRAPTALLDALAPDGRIPLPTATGFNGMDWLVELPTEADVRSVAPDFRALATVDARGVMVTSPPGSKTLSNDPGIDFVSRFFAPACGVDEDPVTGSAHCALGPWWARKLGREIVTGRQISRRGGTVLVTDLGDRVTLEGAAVTVLRGRIDSSMDRDEQAR
jgi:PhzF family phenazine biosynthesis protein